MASRRLLNQCVLRAQSALHTRCVSRQLHVCTPSSLSNKYLLIHARCVTNSKESSSQFDANEDSANATSTTSASESTVSSDNSEGAATDNIEDSKENTRDLTAEAIRDMNASRPHNEQILTEGIAEESIPEPPEAGKSLFRDAVIAALVAMGLGAAYTVYSTKKDSYDDPTAGEINGIRAHITHAINSSNPQNRVFHLQQAELHCRKALEKVGGGYLSVNDKNAVNIQNIHKIGQDETTPDSEGIGVRSIGSLLSDNSATAQRVREIEAKRKGEKAEDRIEYDPGIVALHLQLGRISYMLQKYQTAIDNFLVVLKALSQEFGYQSEELLMPCRQISECYMNLSQLAMAKLFLERALAIVKPSHPQYGPMCEQLAVLLRKQKHWKESIEYSGKALEGATQLLGENHIQISHILLGRACAELEIGQYLECEQSCRMALQIVEFQSKGNATNLGSRRVVNEKLLEQNQQSRLGAIKSGLFGSDGEKEEGLEFTKKDQENADLRELNSKINNTQQIVNEESIEILDMKCGVLFVFGQCLIEQLRYDEAMMILKNALNLAGQLNDQTKQLLIYDQIRDLKQLQTNNEG